MQWETDSCAAVMRAVEEVNEREREVASAAERVRRGGEGNAEGWGVGGSYLGGLDQVWE